MDTPLAPRWFMAILLAGTLAFGGLLLSMLPALQQLRQRLHTGDLHWPGPPAPERGLPGDPLYPALLRDLTLLALVAAGLLLLYVGQTPLLTGVLQIDWPWALPAVTAFLLIAGAVETRATLRDSARLRHLLRESPAADPPSLPSTNDDDQGLPHPLLDVDMPGPTGGQALALFVQGTWLLQTGQTRHGDLLQQQALELDPFLHEHARQALLHLAETCDSRAAGLVYFWLGAHTEHLWDLKQAGSWYEKAASEFHESGWAERESRARCSLGSVKLRLRDETGSAEFERAVVLNPANGAAHLSIARLCYESGGPGDALYERALDEFACAMLTDPHIYGPMVLASLRKAGEGWRRDLELVTRRVEGKGEARPDCSLPVTEPANRKA